MKASVEELAKKKFLEALSEIKNKNYIKSEFLLLECLELVNNRISVLLNLITVYILLKKFNNAKKYIKLCYAKHGKNIDVIANHAYLRFSENQFIKSLLINKYAYKINSNNDTINFNLSILYKNFGNYQKAIFHISKCKDLSKKKFFCNLIFYHDFVINRDEQNYLMLIKNYSNSIDETKYLNINLTNPKNYRISIMTAELKNHAVAHQIKDILKTLSKKYEILIFSNSDTSDNITNEFKQISSEWIDTEKLDDNELINKIRNKNSKYLFSLSGFNRNNRTDIFQSRMSPVQINWCGHLTTSGLKNMDYILGDIYCTPKKFQNFYSEKILNMPQIWSNLSKINEIKIKDTPAYLDHNYITFGCFGKLSKINTHIIEAWTLILKNTGRSKLMLISNEFKDKLFAKKFKNIFFHKGIENERLLLFSNLTRDQYLQKYNDIDIVLDTFPYTGGTTSFEASFMEKPILTIFGNTFLTRCGLSININNQMNEWICKDFKEYIFKACKFANDKIFLKDELNKLKKNRLISVLFDSEKFVKNLNNVLNSIP